MNIIKYRPGRSLAGYDFDKVFNNFFNDSYWPSKTNHPKVDVKEQKDKYILEAELPGLNQDDIDIKIEGDLLTLSSVQEEEKEEKKKEYLIRERSHYEFSRSFTLPKDVDQEKIEASFKNGLLQLTLTKTPEAKPKQIKIKSA
jgi:HSP20 family molecular chaperone IbpA